MLAIGTGGALVSVLWGPEQGFWALIQLKIMTFLGIDCLPLSDPLKRVQRFVTLRDPIQFEHRMEIRNRVAVVNTIVPDGCPHLGKI